MGRLFVVATPIGNLGDISPRAVEVLRNSALIAAEDTRRTIKLLNHFQIRTKMISYHKFNEKEKSEQIIDRICRENIDVSLVSDAGTPCISDPGYELVRQAREEGVEVIGISGPSALITAVSISGFKADSFAFYGFLPRQSADMKKQLARIRENVVDLFVLYESPRRIVKTMLLLAENFPDALACVCSDLTKYHEKSYYGTLDQVVKALRENEDVELGEYTIVVAAGSQKAAEPAGQVGLEALLLDYMLVRRCSLKDAIALLQQEQPDLSRNQIYRASLHLKRFCTEEFDKS